MIRVTRTIALADREVQERFVRASGTRGQNLNKEATAVELRLDIKASSLPPDVKDRLIERAGRGVTARGVLVVVSRLYRSQASNRDAARERLVAILQRAAKAPVKRKPTRPGVVVRETRLADKKRQSAVKVSRVKGGRSKD